MVKIRKADAALMDAPKVAAKRAELTPLQRERIRQQRQFMRLIRGLHGPEDVFEVRLDKSDKPATVRQRLMKVAADQGVEVAVAKHGHGFLVGLMTPERRARRRGRKPSA
jgi:hypothetical protein